MDYLLHSRFITNGCSHYNCQYVLLFHTPHNCCWRNVENPIVYICMKLCLCAGVDIGVIAYKSLWATLRENLCLESSNLIFIRFLIDIVIHIIMSTLELFSFKVFSELFPMLQMYSILLSIRKKEIKLCKFNWQLAGESYKWKTHVYTANVCWRCSSVGVLILLTKKKSSFQNYIFMLKYG